jgi:hypothetical protein
VEPGGEQIEAQLSEDRAPLVALTSLGDALVTLAIAASWPAFCLDERPAVWQKKAAMRHQLLHVLDNMTLRERRGDRRRRGDAIRIAMLIDALSFPQQRDAAASLRARFVDELNEELPSRSIDPSHVVNELDAVDGSLIESPDVWPIEFSDGALASPSSKFFARYFRSEVAEVDPAFVNQLEIRDLGLASPPRIRLGFSASVLMVGAAATAEFHQPIGIVPMVFGLIDATTAIRANLADVRGREAMARALEAKSRADVAREALREEIYIKSQGELERSPELVELVVETALPAVAQLSDPSVGKLTRVLDERGDEPSAS